MSNVYDFFSRKQLSPEPSNDSEELRKNGRYIGMVPKQEAEEINDLIERMNAAKRVIEAFMDNFNDINTAFIGRLADALVRMNVELDAFNPEIHEFYITDSGHAWIINKQLEP